jgi:hypothetical protein
MQKTEFTEAQKNLADDLNSLFYLGEYVPKNKLLLFLKEKGYSVVKTKTAVQRDALEHFCTTELFPDYNAQLNHLII